VGRCFEAPKQCPTGDEPGRGVDTNVMAPFWLINTRPRGQTPVVRKVRNLPRLRVGLLGQPLARTNSATSKLARQDSMTMLFFT